MRILYLENHQEFAQIVRAQFLSAHDVEVTPSLAGARALLRNSTFELLLIDYDLDDGKGTELVTELRACGDHVPIIGVSAREDGNRALLAAGANTAVGKLAFKTIGKVIADVAEQQRQ